MCPVCVANAVMAVAGVSGSAGGVTSVAWKILQWKKRLARNRRTEWRFLPVRHDCATGRAARAARKSEFQPLRSE
jgi:hypothetical protein